MTANMSFYAGEICQKKIIIIISLSFYFNQRFSFLLATLIKIAKSKDYLKRARVSYFKLADLILSDLIMLHM